jgi:phytoene dehydrogenase-like protein
MGQATTFDAIIIGGGHNGLVTACRLAKAGKRVLLLERRHVLGGACVTETDTFPGFRVSTAAYLNGLLRPEIIREFRLADYGLRMLQRNPSSFTPLPDGRHLLLGPDEELNRREIAKFSPRDAERFFEYEAMFDRVAAVLTPLLMEPPSDGALAARIDGLSPDRKREVLDILTGSAAGLLERYFESEAVKATIATDGVIGTFAPPSAAGTAYVMFHHVMGETFGFRGVWSYVRGGMGMISQSLAAAARDLGADIRTDAEVDRIIVEGGAAVGVVLKGGQEFRARVVASNATARVTFKRLLPAGSLPPAYEAAVDRVDYSSASVKINVALERLPSFRCLPGHEPGPQHRGTAHISPDMDYLERAFEDANRGRPSGSPILELAWPSVLDDTAAPAGKHLMTMFTQYAPYKLREGTWDQAARDRWADRCFDLLEEYAPGFKGSVIARQVLAPPDLEEKFGLTGGNIFQGALSAAQLYTNRCIPGGGDGRTPVRGLYLCGSAIHPGGGVMGAPGWNAAGVILKDTAVGG